MLMIFPCSPRLHSLSPNFPVYIPNNSNNHCLKFNTVYSLFRYRTQREKRHVIKCFGSVKNGEELSCELYNENICDFCKEGDIDNAMIFLAEMEALGFHPNHLSYSCLISTLGNFGRTSEAEALFQEMMISKPRIKVYNSLLRAFLRKGLLKQANKVVTAIEDLGIEKNRETFEILVSYYTNAGRLEDTWSIINKMRQQGFKLNSYIYSKIIELYRDNGMWKKAVEILREIKDEGIPLDKKIYNSIIDTFGKHGDLEGALEVFDQMPIRPDITTWNSLIRWHLKYSEVEKAVELFSRMQEQGGMYPDPKIFIRLINSLGEQGKWDLIKNNYVKMKFRGHEKSAVIYAVLVDILLYHGRFYDDVEKCVYFLDSQGVELSPNIFCLLTNAYAQQGLCEQTVKVMQLMEVQGIEPNIIMLNVLMNAFGIAGRHLEAQSVYHQIKESGVSPDVVTYTTLMKAFIRASKFDQVPAIYEEMERSGCAPDRKARGLLQTAIMLLDNGEFTWMFGCCGMVADRVRFYRPLEGVNLTLLEKLL